jgi:Domain of unknown function (DUF4864)
LQRKPAKIRRCIAHKSICHLTTLKFKQHGNPAMTHKRSAAMPATAPGAANRLHLLALMLITTFALLFAPVPARADTESEIKAVIESQLNAFAADDGAGAYLHAAPIVRQIFPTPDMFMAMVKKGYQPVYRNTARVFSKMEEDSLGRPAMRVALTGKDGIRYEAFYAMEKQADGTWKIAGCTILTIPAQEV